MSIRRLSGQSSLARTLAVRLGISRCAGVALHYIRMKMGIDYSANTQAGTGVQQFRKQKPDHTRYESKTTEREKQMSKKVPCSFCTEKIDARSIGAHEKKHIRMGDHKVSVSNGVPVLKLISEKTVIVS